MSKYTKFKKVETDKTRSKVTPMEPEKVEEEVLEAVKEAKKEIKEDKPVFKSVGTCEVTYKDPPKPEKVRPKPHGLPTYVIQQLRTKDHIKLNKTCSRCARRVPLAQIDDGKADICDDCK